MLEQIDALPGAKRKPALGDGDRQRHGGERRLDVRGHIVRPFGGVHDPAHGRVVGRWHKPAKEGVEVAAYVRVSVLLDQQRAGCVAHEDGEETSICAGALHEVLCFIGELVKPLPARGQRQHLLGHVTCLQSGEPAGAARSSVLPMPSCAGRRCRSRDDGQSPANRFAAGTRHAVAPAQDPRRRRNRHA